MSDNVSNIVLSHHGRTVGERGSPAADNTNRESEVGRDVQGLTSQPSGRQEVSGDTSSTKELLDQWLHCCRCGALQLIWAEDVVANSRVDLVGCLGLLGVYFYTTMDICVLHVPLLAQCCQLTIDTTILWILLNSTAIGLSLYLFYHNRPNASYKLGDRR